MGWISSAYWVCLFVGIGYTVISFILGGFGHGMDAHGAGGEFSHDYGVGGSGGHGDASGTGDTGAVIFGPFSPVVVAFFLTCLGATGIVMTQVLDQPVFISMPVSIAASVGLAWVLIKTFNRLLGSIQSSSEVKLYTLIGCEGEVTVDIPANGIGEIAYVAMGSRCVSPARSDEAVTIPRHSGIRITRVIGNMFCVRPLVEEQLRNLDAAAAPER